MSILCIAMVDALLLRYMVKRVRRSSSFRRNTPQVATVRRRRVKHCVKLTEGSPVQHLGLGRRENHVLREGMDDVIVESTCCIYCLAIVISVVTSEHVTVIQSVAVRSTVILGPEQATVKSKNKNKNKNDYLSRVGPRRSITKL